MWYFLPQKKKQVKNKAKNKKAEIIKRKKTRKQKEQNDQTEQKQPQKNLELYTKNQNKNASLIFNQKSKQKNGLSDTFSVIGVVIILSVQYSPRAAVELNVFQGYRMAL